MPEGPELRMNSIFINNVCRGLVFSGCPIKSSVSKNPEIKWDSPRYTITSGSRGKELALSLQCLETMSRKTLRILFRFGMSGKFTFTSLDAIPKHAHLQFHTEHKNEQEGKRRVLSYVDPRRFGSWHETEEWGEGRGPDIINEYDQFRECIFGNLDDPVFKKPMCEAMLNQKYFNGIGNYLRAEVLFRAKIPPFTCAREVLETIKEEEEEEEEEVKAAAQASDVLRLCRDIYQEVIQLKIGLGKAEIMTTSVSKEDHDAFLNWLQCYNNPNMSIMKDRNKRSVWFQGDPGPMAPKGARTKATKRKYTPDNPNPVIATGSSPLKEKGKVKKKPKEKVQSPQAEVKVEKNGKEEGMTPEKVGRRRVTKRQRSVSPLMQLAKKVNRKLPLSSPVQSRRSARIRNQRKEE